MINEEDAIEENRISFYSFGRHRADSFEYDSFIDIKICHSNDIHLCRK
jgi:hypothetical protein